MGFWGKAAVDRLVSSEHQKGGSETLPTKQIWRSDIMQEECVYGTSLQQVAAEAAGCKAREGC